MHISYLVDNSRIESLRITLRRTCITLLPLRSSQSVTPGWQKRLYLLQIETIRRALYNSSRSVTVRQRFVLYALQIETNETMNQKPPRREATPPRRLAFAQINSVKINLSLFGRLALPEVGDERRAVLLLGFDQDVVDVGLDGAHGKEQLVNNLLV